MGKENGKLRNPNIELLCVVLAAFVCFLHLNYFGEIGLLQLPDVVGAKSIFSK